MSIAVLSRHFRKSMARTWLILVTMIVFALIIISGLYVMGTLRHVPLADITRDPAAVYEHYYIGILSNIGIMLWASAASILLLGAILLVKIPLKSRFLFISSALTTLLAVDDALLVHETVIPYLFHIPEDLVYGAYLVLIFAYLIYFLRYILSETNYPILALALMFFGLSIFFDVFIAPIMAPDIEAFFEDSAKFIGINLWLCYYFLTVLKIARPHISITELEVSAERG